jgi:hypothetical protein
MRGGCHAGLADTNRPQDKRTAAGIVETRQAKLVTDPLDKGELAIAQPMGSSRTLRQGHAT